MSNHNAQIHEGSSYYRDRECDRCGRRYPDTVLNIEAVQHHNASVYECVDRKDCKKAKKKKND